MPIGVLNLGLKSIRFIVFDHSGKLLASKSIPVTSWLHDECVEQDALEWVMKAEAVISDVAHCLPSGTIEALSISASASCLVYTDANLKPLGRVIMVSDKRAQKEAADVQAALAKHLPEGSDLPRVSADQLAPKVLWLMRNAQEDWRRVRHVMGAADFLGAFLAGHVVTDTLSATKFLYDPLTRRYPLQLFEHLGINEAILPNVVEPGANTGPMRKQLARRLGLPGNPNYVVSSYDAICGSYGAGMREPGDASDMSGTVTSVRAISKGIPRCGKGLYVTPGLQSKTWLVGGSNNLCGGLVEWAKGIASLGGEEAYARMQTMATEAGAMPDGLLFLPYLMGERAPLWDPTAKGAFLGLNRSHSIAHLVRSILEGACFSMRMLVEAIKDYRVEVNRVFAGGGLTRLDFVNQLKANIIGMPLIVSTQFEATSLGTAMVCAAGSGAFASLPQAVESMSQGGTVIEPDWPEVERYDEGYELFKDAYRTLRPWFERHARFASESWAGGGYTRRHVNL